MKRAIIFCFLLSTLAVSCQGSLVEKETAKSTLSEKESALLARDEIEEIVGEQLVQVNWVKLKSGNLIFGINYAADLKPASHPDAFFDQFNRVALVASTYFYQTNTQAVNIMVMAEDIDFPTADRNPPLYQVVIEKKDVSAWVIGEITDAEFIESWYVVPLAVFPTPG